MKYKFQFNCMQEKLLLLLSCLKSCLLPRRTQIEEFTTLPLTPYPLPLTPYPLPLTPYPLPLTPYPLPLTPYPLPLTPYPLPLTPYPLPLTPYTRPSKFCAFIASIFKKRLGTSMLPPTPLFKPWLHLWPQNNMYLYIIG